MIEILPDGHRIKQPGRLSIRRTAGNHEKPANHQPAQSTDNSSANNPLGQNISLLFTPMKEIPGDTFGPVLLINYFERDERR